MDKSGQSYLDYGTGHAGRVRQEYNTAVYINVR